MKKWKNKIQHYILRKHCPYCRSSDIKLMTQTEFYGREYSGAKMYVCQKCRARVGCHKGTEIPLGPLADSELIELRKKIHAIIDTQWKNPTERSEMYHKLAEEFGMEKNKFHVGFLKNEQARWVLYKLERDNS